MSKRPERLVHTWDEGGVPRGIAVYELNLNEDGVPVSEAKPVPLSGVDNPIYQEIKEQWNVGLVDENERLRLLVSDLQGQLSEVMSNLGSVRHISPDAFTDRLTKRELQLLASTSDAGVAAVAQKLMDVVGEARLMSLDSEETLQGLQYLVEYGVLDEERVGELLADSSALERKI